MAGIAIFITWMENFGRSGILVTGGTGLVGSHLLFELARHHDRIRAIRRPSSDIERVKRIFSLYTPDGDGFFSRIEWVEADTSDPVSIDNFLERGMTVYHCAAMVSFDPGRRKTMIRTNVKGTANLVNSCLDREIHKLCYVSSTAALGAAPVSSSVTENMIWSASGYRSAYSLSKFQSEMEVWRGMAEGLRAVIVNPSIVIGPGDWNRSSSRLFTAVWKGMKYYTEGVTGYVDARDVARAMRILTEGEYSGERYILSSENLSYRNMLEMIARELDRQPPSRHAGVALTALACRLDWLNHHLTGRPRNITRDTVKSSRNRSYFSNEKFRKSTGMEFRPVQESVRDTACYFKDQIRQTKD